MECENVTVIGGSIKYVLYLKLFIAAIQTESGRKQKIGNKKQEKKRKAEAGEYEINLSLQSSSTYIFYDSEENGE